MHRLLERLDGAASTIVPLLYLVGLIGGTMAYFTGITLDISLAVGTALAFAAEAHLFLQMRRVRMAYSHIERTKEDSEQHEIVVRQFRVNLAILSALMVFSTYNSIAFVSETFHPAPGFLPAGAQVAIRGGVVPALFLLAGFLTPLAADASVLLRAASHRMLHKTIKRSTRQWDRRIDKAYRANLDLAPIAMTLMEDAGDADGARRIGLIAKGLADVEGTSQRRALDNTPDPLDAYPRPLPNGFPLPVPVTPPGGWHPTNGGSPAGMPIPGYSGPDSDTFPGTQAWESIAEEAGTLARTRAVATVQPASGNSPERDAQQAYVNTYLNRLPLTSRKALREHLNIRYDDARAMYETWYWEYGGAAKIAAAKAAEREQARERSAQVAQ